MTRQPTGFEMDPIPNDTTTFRSPFSAESRRFGVNFGPAPRWNIPKRHGRNSLHEKAGAVLDDSYSCGRGVGRAAESPHRVAGREKRSGLHAAPGRRAV